MELLEAMSVRHAVRTYSDKRIEGKVKESLQQKINECNQEGNLHIQLVTDEPKAFDGFMAHYGKFSGVSNYIALIGPKGDDLDEKVGYYGEKIVLYAQQLGLNTCWVYSTYSKVKTAYNVDKGEKLCLVIAIGYGNTQGKNHKSKSIQEVSTINEDTPEWFKAGVEAALLAPTAINQQKFKFTLTENKVVSKAGVGVCSKVDLGIVKYHFEIGAGKENFEWKE